jgi:inorganic pyrophosphatase
MFRMRDEMGLDDQVLCVAATDPRMAHLRDIQDVPEFDRLEIRCFFEAYTALEPGKEAETSAWADQRPPSARSRRAGRARAALGIKAASERRWAGNPGSRYFVRDSF